MTQDEQTDVRIHEDEICHAVMPKKGAAAGHIIIKLNKPRTFLKELSEQELDHIFYVASFAATAVFETAGAQGTNIIVNEGTFTDKPLEFHIIPRMMEDGLDFRWEPKQMDPSDMDSALSALKDKAFYIGKTTSGDDVREETEQKETDKESESQPSAEPEMHVEGEGEDYRVKNLRRIP